LHHLLKCHCMHQFKKCIYQAKKLLIQGNHDFTFPHCVFSNFNTLSVWSQPNAHEYSVSQILDHLRWSPQRTGFTVTTDHKLTHQVVTAAFQMVNTHNNSKGKVHPRTGYKDSAGEYRYGSTLYLTAALDGWGETWYPLRRRLDGHQG
jgi:hypothetical protein